MYVYAGMVMLRSLSLSSEHYHDRPVMNKVMTFIASHIILFLSHSFFVKERDGIC